jgi:hypothetical protein
VLCELADLHMIALADASQVKWDDLQHDQCSLPIAHRDDRRKLTPHSNVGHAASPRLVALPGFQTSVTAISERKTGSNTCTYQNAMSAEGYKSRLDSQEFRPTGYTAGMRCWRSKS